MERLAQKRPVGVVSIASKVLMVERVGHQGDPFSTDEMAEVFRFNEKHMGVSYCRSERRDLLCHYIKRAFFMIGDVG